MKRLISFLFILTSFIGAKAQTSESDLLPFIFFDSEGNAISYQDVLDSALESEVFLFGELHNDAIIHWVQYRLVRDLSATQEIILGGEFFEVDDQLALQEYMNGLIPEKNLDDEIHLWPNYETDYAPFVQLARDSGMAFFATNVPRRYAALVSKFGLDTLNFLSAEAKAFLPQLPIPFSMETPGYAEMIEMMGGHAGGADMSNFVKAQALKDATMATNIIKNRKSDSPFIHFNGDFHSASYGGIYWYLKKFDSNLKVSTLKVFSSENMEFLEEYRGTGDIILIVPSDFTKTH